jgi:hypothetical protein
MSIAYPNQPTAAYSTGYGQPGYLGYPGYGASSAGATYGGSYAPTTAGYYAMPPGTSMGMGMPQQQPQVIVVKSRRKSKRRHHKRTRSY